MSVEEISCGLTVDIPLAALAGEAAASPVIWRHALEDRAAAAIASLGATFVGGGTGWGGTDFQISVPATSLEAAFIALGDFLAATHDVPAAAVLATYDRDDLGRTVTVGELRARR